MKNLISQTTGKISAQIGDSSKFSNRLTEKNYYAFGAFLIVGGLFLFLSLTFLPLIFFAPNKFNLFFSLGSLFLHCSMSFFYGPMTYIGMLFKRENFVITPLYMGSLFLSIFSSLFWGSYFLAFLILALQV